MQPSFQWLKLQLLLIISEQLRHILHAELMHVQVLSYNSLACSMQDA